MADADVRQRVEEGEIAKDESARLPYATPTTVAPTDVAQTADDPALTEDLALSLLTRADLQPQILERLARNAGVLKSRKVKMALASHPRTPRHVSVPLARQFYTFDLMKLALSPGAPADVKVAVDDILIARLETVTIGERLALARRAAGRVAAALLLDGDKANVPAIEAKIADCKTQSPRTRVMLTALDNPRLTEALVISSVLRADASAALVHAIASHAKWSSRREIRVALLRTEHLSLACGLEFSSEIPTEALRELLDSSRLPMKIKEQILRVGEER
ncbi:MAG TPA: hypothetical protein VK828_21655 [Terriglobales bacterium]|jgi:hypothetical protein|nr:hypothetical protein [Terriglobales bacterium]